jgi:phytoene dehydrogenase-like protein
MGVEDRGGGIGVEMGDDGPIAVIPDRPVCIVGAGVSGLACALRLYRAGVPVRVFEGASRVGGRVGSEFVDGFRFDNGFQVLLDSYEELAGVLDVPALNLRGFEPGCVVRWRGDFYPLFDPVRRPLAVPRMMAKMIGSWRDWMKIVGLRARWVNRQTVRFSESPGLSVREFLEQERLSTEIIERFFRPFFGGVFLEHELSTAACFFPFIFSRFSAGSATLPEGGMQAVPDQLAAGLPAGVLSMGRRIAELGRNHLIDECGERIEAALVVDARSLGADPKILAHGAAVHFIEIPAPLPERCTLYLGADDGSTINVVAPLSDVQPSYAPAGRHLVAVTCYTRSSLSIEETGEVARRELATWFGFQMEMVRLLGFRSISRALPHFISASNRVSQRDDGRYRIGDVTEYPSLNGALRSARIVAESISRRVCEGRK